MGTKAVFAIAADGAFWGYHERIVGMTHDGTMDNLRVLARGCYRIARKLRVLTAFRHGDLVAIMKVQDELVRESNGWLFIDAVRNAQWVTYSAILDPGSRKLDLYYGLMESRLTTVKNILDT
jgi:hypothetical protein